MTLTVTCAYDPLMPERPPRRYAETMTDECRHDLAPYVGGLAQRDQLILKHYDAGVLPSEIGRLLGMSANQVHRLVRKAQGRPS